MGGEVLQAVAFEIFQAFELVLFHERQKLLVHLLDDRVAEFHDAGADLDGVAAEQDELGGVGAGFDAADAAERAAGEFGFDYFGDFHAHPQGDWHDGLAGVAAGRGVTFDAWLGPQRFEVDAEHAADRVDGGDAVAAGAERGTCWVFDVRDVGRHLGPDGLFGDFHYPAADFAENIRILAHGGAHFALGQAVRAGHVELERIAAGVLAAFDDFVPGVVVVFLHDRGDENAFGVLVFDLLEFFDPGFEAAIGDELDIFPAVDFARFAAAETRRSAAGR